MAALLAPPPGKRFALAAGSLALALATACCLAAADGPASADPGLGINPSGANAASSPGWAGFVETNFPFFSTTLDARGLGAGWPEDNLTPRGLVLNLGHDCWVCFDLDLLRVAATWTGRAVTPVSMAQGSYHRGGAKALEGQTRLPEIDGSPWLANGIYPGWQIGEVPALSDPRAPGPDAKEVGRGPLARGLGRFQSIRQFDGGVCLEYEVAGAQVTETLEARWLDGHASVQRGFRVASVPRSLCVVLGRRPSSAPVQLAVQLAGTNDANGHSLVELGETEAGTHFARLHPSATPVEFRVAFALGTAARTWTDSLVDRPPRPRWSGEVATQVDRSTAQDPFVVDNCELPLANPWRRNVRLADVAFRLDGDAFGVTFDGDVWWISGFDTGRLRWRRFASGFHEPLSLVVRKDEIFIYDRNGIWRLRDRDGNGEADVHELYANAFTQTAETREFATSMKLAPDGSFVIAKGGQQSSTLGQHNGTVLRVSPDGETATVLGWGLRMPFIGVHPRTGWVTASDQQGHYVPATPLHVIRDNQFYGFLPLFLPKEKYPAPIAEPLTWIPHPINPSGVCQVWLTGAKMGPLNDALLHLGYYRPEVFLVLVNDLRDREEAAVVSLTRDLAFPPLSGAVRPQDGQLYVAGFQIWGSEARQISGLARLRYTGAPNPYPRAVQPTEQGVLLQFDLPLRASSATNLANFSAERWNYRRTANYGSPHYRLDGSKGQEAMPPASVYLSKDARRVFVGIADMKPVMQMRLGWALESESGAALARNAYFTPRVLRRFDPVAEGFGPLRVDLSLRATTPAADPTPITAAEGKRLSELMGCVACHSLDGTTLGKVGPTWKGLFGRERQFTDGTRQRADESYLRQSIREPTAKIVRGFDQSDTGMPSYEGVITDAQIEALVEYLKTFR